MSIEEKMQVKSESQTTNQCFTCLGHSEECMRILSDAMDSDSVTVVDLLTQHFWFQRDEFTSAQRFICENCWNRLDDFHRFYQQVEENHLDLSWQPSETCQPADDSNGVDQMHSEIEMKVEDVQIHSEVETEEEGAQIHTEIEIKVEDVQVHSEAEIEEEGTQIHTELEIKVEDSHIHSEAESKEQGFQIHTDIEIKEEDSWSPSEDVESEFEDGSASSSEAERSELVNELWPSNGKLEAKQNRTKDTDKNADEIIKAHRQYNCRICEKHFKTFGQLKKHLEEVHEFRAGVICCGKFYTTKRDLLDHVLKLEDPEWFKCNICGKILTHSKALKKHKKELHAEEEERKYHCDQCPRRFQGADALSSHIEKHTKFQKESTKCPHCPGMFRTMYMLKRHIRAWHKNGNFVNDACEKVFAKERYIQQDMLQHTLSPEDQRVQCTICDKWLKNKNSLSVHFLIHTAPMKCDVCGLVLGNHRALGYHKRKKHQTESSSNALVLSV